MKVVQERSERSAFATVLFNQFDQLPLKGVLVVVNPGRLR